MHPTLNIAIKAARRAATVINRAALDVDLLRVEAKQPNDFVTEVDRAAEEAIIQVLREAYPSHSILAEESGETGPAADTEYQWIIDPLDGTTNFIHGFPQYAISIALARKGVVEQAVVFDPNRNELFTASKGAGAFLNDRRIRVSKCTRIDDALRSNALAIGRADVISLDVPVLALIACEEVVMAQVEAARAEGLRRRAEQDEVAEEERVAQQLRADRVNALNAAAAAEATQSTPTAVPAMRRSSSPSPSVWAGAWWRRPI